MIMADDDLKSTLERMFADYLGAMDPPLTPPLHLEIDTTPLLETFEVRQFTGFLQVSNEVARDTWRHGAEHAPPRPAWHRRARWRWQEWRERAGRRIGGWIANADLSEHDPYDD